MNKNEQQKQRLEKILFREERERRKKWHNYFVKNKDRFTDIDSDELRKLGFIYIEKAQETVKRKFPQDFTLYQYQGSWKDIY